MKSRRDSPDGLQSIRSRSYRQLALVANRGKDKIYLSPTSQDRYSFGIDDDARPDAPIFSGALGIRVHNYGITNWGEFFHPRQLRALSEFSELMKVAYEMALEHRPNVRQSVVARDTLIHLVGLGQGISLTTEATSGTSFPHVVFRPIAGNSDVLPFSGDWLRRRLRPISTARRRRRSISRLTLRLSPALGSGNRWASCKARHSFRLRRKVAKRRPA